MKFKLFSSEYSAPISLALGFFDCIHKGHRKLISACRESEYETAVFTFSNDPATLFGGEKQIYNFQQRLKIFESLGVEVVISEIMTKDFASMEPKTFLDKLFKNFNIKEINVGSDYTFGKNASGNIELLNLYCREHGCKLNVHPFITDELNLKISSSKLKEYVKSGEVDKLNKYLDDPYFVSGTVVSCRKEGRILGFPTANIDIPEDMLILCEGVYATKLKINGKEYNSMTNVGRKPTFGIEKYSIESYIFEFSDDIYGQEIEISFIYKTRNIIKFESETELKKQLLKDEIIIKDILK